LQVYFLLVVILTFIFPFAVTCYILDKVTFLVSKGIIIPKTILLLLMTYD